EMEPGGIEPPCRGSRQGASTRVVDDLISALGRPSTACPVAQLPGTSSPDRPGAPRSSQSDDRRQSALSDVRPQASRVFKPRVRTAVRQLLVLCAFHEDHTPRRATPNLSCPVDTRSAPDPRLYAAAAASVQRPLWTAAPRASRRAMDRR